MCKSGRGLPQSARVANLDVPVAEEILDECSIETTHPGVMDGEAVGEDIAQLIVLRLLRLASKDLARRSTLSQEPAERLLLETRADDGLRGLRRLLARMDEDENLQLGRNRENAEGKRSS